MVDVFTSTATLSNQVQTAFDRVARMALRENVVFDSVARVKPARQSMPGDSVTFDIWNDLAPATTPINEVVDIDAVGLTDAPVTVTLDEYGSAILTTVRLRAFTYVLNFDADAANMVAWNMVESLDALSRAALDAATNVTFGTDGGSGINSIAVTEELTAPQVREQHARLVDAKVMPFELASQVYLSVISPFIAFDLKDETGDGAWIAPHQYTAARELFANEMGTFGGFRFIESGRARLEADAGDGLGGAGLIDVYSTYFFGRECLAKAVAVDPHVVPGPITDKLLRWAPLGWHAICGYGILRQPAIRLVKSASSIGDNA